MPGNRDVLIPPPNSFQIAGAIPSAQIREIDDAGNIFWISHPEETSKIVTESLEQNFYALSRLITKEASDYECYS